MNQPASKKILIIEDDTDYASLLDHVLEKAGFTTVIINQPTEVLDKIQKEAPDLILLDIMLPNVSGLSILEELKKTDKTKRIPVFCVTNLPEEVGREKAISLGAYSYLTKVHYDIYDILKRVELYFKEEA